MADENGLAVTLATETPVIESPVNDGIIDLDAPQEVKEEPAEDEEGKEAQPEAAGEKPPAGEEGKPPKLSGAQRAKIREARLLNELAARERELEELRRPAPAAKPAGETGDDKPPREEDFNGDWFAFQRALTAFEAGGAARKAIRDEFKTREDSERSTKQAEIARERKVAHLERVEDAREVIADFDTAMKAMDGVQVRQEVIDEIMASDNSAVISYHLAKNPDKLSAMNQMSGRELAREMGRLEATVRLPEAKRATTAPAPLSHLKGGSAPASQEQLLANYINKRYGKGA